MLRFLEDEKKKNAKLVYDFFWNEEDQCLDFYRRRHKMTTSSRK